MINRNGKRLVSTGISAALLAALIPTTFTAIPVYAADSYEVKIFSNTDGNGYDVEADEDGNVYSVNITGKRIVKVDDGGNHTDVVNSSIYLYGTAIDDEGNIFFQNIIMVFQVV